MSTIACPHCNADTPDEYNFCIACDKQVKCLNPDCNKKLITGKTFCFSCGQGVAQINLPQSQPNTYIRDVTQKGNNYAERVEFSVSDHAVSELAPFIVGQMASQSPRRTYDVSKLDNVTTSSTGRDASTSIGAAREIPQLPANAPEREQPQIQANGASRYFERDGEQLAASEKDFKGKNWADQQRNFIVLYALAYQEVFQAPVPSRESFKNVAEKTGINDPNNFTRYLSEAISEHFTELTNGLKLNQRGEKEVARILSLMDSQTESGYEYWGRAASTPAKRHRMSKEDRDKVREWAQEEIHIGGLDIRTIKQARDYALLSIWIITVDLQKAQAIHWNEAHLYLKEKFQAISASAEAFSAAVRSDNNKEYFRTSGELLFLSPEGKSKVEGWIAGNSVQTPGEEEGGSDN